jgi:hypothetical protein
MPFDIIRIRRDTFANWESVNPTLALGEISYDLTNDQIRVGDGTNLWLDLPAIGNSVISDGDKGDIVVSSNGTTWSLDPALINTINNKLDQGPLDGGTPSTPDQILQIRRGNTLSWAGVVLGSGEVGYDSDVNEIRIGDGLSTWDNLDPIGFFKVQNINLQQLGDVDYPTPLLAGQVLTWDGNTWVNDVVPEPTYNLNALTDVVITTPSNTQVLQYNGTNWVNATVQQGAGVTTGSKNEITVVAENDWQINPGVIEQTNLNLSTPVNPQDAATKDYTDQTIGLAITANVIDELDQPNGLAVLNSNRYIATNRLGSGTADSTTYLRGDGTWNVVTSGITDHGELNGLLDDDHTQYHTDARGDARYSQLGHTHTISNITNLQTSLDNKQNLDPTLSGLANTAIVGADRLIYSTGNDAFTTTTITSLARNLLDDTTTTQMQTTLGLGGVLGTSPILRSDLDLSTYPTGQALGTLGDGLLKNTTSLGVGTLSIATGSDLPNHTHAVSNLLQSGAITGDVIKWNGTTWAPATDNTNIGITDGDKGDILVSNSGATWTIETANNAAISGGTVTNTSLVTGTYSSPLGETVMKKVFNNTGSPFTKGQVVYVVGSQGDNLTVALADADAEITAATTIGVVAESIADQATGYIITQGPLTELSGITTPFVNGDALWLGSTPGTFTRTRPTQPAHGVSLGWVVRTSNGNAGIIYVKVTNGQELEELHDVKITTPVDGQIIKYDATTSLWTNQTNELVRYWDFELDSNMGIIGRGDWCEGPSTTGDSYYYAGGMATITLSDTYPGARGWLKSTGQGLPTTGAGSPSVEIDEYDLVFSFKGFADTLLSDNTTCVGFFRTHGGIDETDVYERLIGFYNDRTTGQWKAAIWKIFPAGTGTPYVEVWTSQKSTGAYADAPAQLEVIITERGQKALFYADKKLIGEAPASAMPAPNDSPTGIGDKLLWGVATRDLNDTTNPSGVFTFNIMHMTCRQYKVGSLAQYFKNNLNDLLDVDSANIDTDTVLRWNGNVWEYTFPRETIANMLDVKSFPVPNNGDILIWDASTLLWTPGSLSGFAPISASYIVKTPNATLTNEFALSTLNTGLLKVTNGTGDLSIATGSDLPLHTHSVSDITGLGTLATLNSVGSAQITDLSVGTPELAAGAVTGVKIANNTINFANKVSTTGIPLSFYISDATNGSTWQLAEFNSDTFQLTELLDLVDLGVPLGKLSSGGATGGQVIKWNAIANQWVAADEQAANLTGLAPDSATYIVKTPNETLTSEFALSTLGTGLLKNTTGTGDLSIATGSDLPSHTHVVTDISATGTPSNTTFLRGDGAWATPSGGGSGTPAGTTGQVQFNDAGAFGADDGFIYDSATEKLVVGSGTNKFQTYSDVYQTFIAPVGGALRIRHPTGGYITVGDSSATGPIGTGTHILVSANDASITNNAQLIWNRAPLLQEQLATFQANVNLQAGLLLNNSQGTSGQVLTSTGTGVQWATPSGGGGGGFTPIRQAYTTSTSNIAIPVGASKLRILAWGGGGGGGGGALNTAGLNRCGGAGGGGAAALIYEYPVSLLSGTLSVTIGAGGTGGNGATTSGGTPQSGTAGGTTSVTGTLNGVSMRLCYGMQGFGGGVNATGTTSTPGGGGPQGYPGGQGGGGTSTSGGIGAQTSATGFNISGHGGGGGGGVNTSNVNATGGISFGSYVPPDNNVSGGLAGGGNGDSESAGRGTNWDFSRAGGGGGGSNNAGSGGNGGNGGYGAGGGGGGAGTNLGSGETGGKGGNGGQGLVILYWS